MKRTLVSILIIAQTGFFTMGFSVASATQSVDKVNDPVSPSSYVANEVVVELTHSNKSTKSIKDDVFSQVVAGLRPVALNVAGVSSLRKNQGPRYTLKINDGTNAQLVAEQLRSLPGVISAAPNFIYHVTQTANDSNFPLKDDLYNSGSNVGRTGETKDADIDAELAWKTTMGSGSVVAIIDTGVQMTHPDLQDNIWTNAGEIGSNSIDDEPNGFVDDVHGWDFVDNDNDPSPSGVGAERSHGTHVAGIAAAELNNAAGVSGVAPAAKIMPLRTFTSDGSATTEDILNAMDYAVANGADVINMSFSTDIGSYDPNFDAPILTAYNAGVVLVAAAGNGVLVGPSYVGQDLSLKDSGNHYMNRVSPITNDCGNTAGVGNNCTTSGQNLVLGVASVSNSDARAGYSNYSLGSNNFIDLSAPGGEVTASSREIYSTVDSGDATFGGQSYAYEAGTSMATPQVVGVVALVRGTNQALTTSNVMTMLRNNADANLSSGMGAGRVNAAHAVNNAIMTRFDGGGGGANRYDVAVQTSTMTFPVDGSATTVAIASGTSFADGLAGSGMARFKNGPLLLTDKSGLASGTLAEIQRLLGNASKQIYILGGTAAVSSNIETQLDGIGYTNYARVIGGGVDRVDTAIGIANISNPGTVTEAIMVNKDNFPDGVSASAVTAKRNIPLLVNASNTLDSRNSTWLTTHHVTRVYLVGGTTVLATNIENQLHALSVSTTRLANTDRYGTSAEVAKCFFSTTSSSVCNGVTSGRAQPKQVGYAVGTNFPDALSGGPYMGYYGGPMLLVQSTAVPTFIQNYNTLAKGSARDGFIFGGTSAINNTVSTSLASQLK